jgi:hypothetical protein
MRDKLLFQDWERLEKDDLNTMEELCSGGLGKAIEAIAKPVREWRSAQPPPGFPLPWYPPNALWFARGCVLRTGQWSLDTVAKKLTITGAWRFVFADPDIEGAKGQIVDWTGTIAINNAYEQNRVTLIMAKPVWEMVQEERQVGDPGTGLFSKQAIEKRYRFTSLAFQIVDVTHGNFFTGDIKGYQAQGYHFFAVTYTQNGTGTVELCYVFPPVLDALGLQLYPNLSVQSALWALAGAVKLLRDGTLVERPYDAKDIATPLVGYDKANVVALHDRVTALEENQIAFAVTLTTGTNQFEDDINIATVSWNSGSSAWTVTYNGPEPKRILAQADQRAGLDTPYTLVSLQHVSTSKQVLVRILEWDDSNRTWRAYNQEEPAKVYLLGLGVKE